MNSGFTTMVQFNYPYPASVIGPEMPAFPANVSCGPIIDYADNDNVNVWELFEAVKDGLTTFYGNSTCNDILGEGLGAGMGETWGYQTCTELLMPIGSNGKNDIFNYAPFNFT